LNHWDNLNRYVERGYAGISIWNWHTLPGYIDQRYIDYARANASIGINGTVLTNVNANAMILTKPYLEKVAALADVFRPYGIKVYLTASQQERAERRYKQLIEKGMSDTLESLLRDIRERDARDAGRATAPLAAAPDAVILDTTGMTIAAAIQFVLDRYGAVWPGTTSKH